jgi:cytochrome c biogenesis protein CcmG/thiol:disulfide interchange protein DsbE
VVIVIAALALVPTALAYPELFGLKPAVSDVIVIGRDVNIDKPAPDFTLATTSGETVTLSSLRGRPVIVNFWASWCIPCRSEFPLLVDAYRKYSADGLQIVGVIHDDGPETASAFARSYGATWPLALDPGNEAWNAYRASGVPLSYYIDRAGIVRAVSYGPPPSGFLDDQIRQIL